MPCGTDAYVGTQDTMKVTRAETMHIEYVSMYNVV